MRAFNFLSIIITMIAFISGSRAYDDNCDGSVRTAKAVDCNVAIARVIPEDTYTAGSEFSYGTCYLVYKTSNQGLQRIKGQVILDTIRRIYDNCPRHKTSNGLVARGSYGTGNCPLCHVTINYREDPGHEAPCPPC